MTKCSDCEFLDIFNKNDVGTIVYYSLMFDYCQVSIEKI